MPTAQTNLPILGTKNVNDCNAFVGEYSSLNLIQATEYAMDVLAVTLAMGGFILGLIAFAHVGQLNKEVQLLKQLVETKLKERDDDI